MKEFLLLYRGDWVSERSSPDEMQARTKKWMDWIGSIASQNKLVDRGNRLMNDGKVMRGSVVTDGPYLETKEFIGGYSIIRAESYANAVELAKNCPGLESGGAVEVREISVM